MTPRRRSTMTWLMIVALTLAAAFTSYHVVRSVRAFLFWHQHRDEPIQPWMTIGFVAHSYHLPPPVLHAALDLPPEPDHRSLQRIAAAEDVPYVTIRARLYRAIVHSRPPYPPPAPPPPARPRP